MVSVQVYQVVISLCDSMDELCYSPFIIAAISSCTLPIGLILNFSTRTLATLGERNAGRVGPKRIPLTPR